MSRPPTRHQRGQNPNRGSGATRPAPARGGSRGRVEAAPIKRPERYVDEAGNTRHQLFDEEARPEAEWWAYKDIKSSQIRRFYGQVQAARRRLELEGPKAKDEEALVAMALLRMGTAYAAARDNSREPLAKFAECYAARVKTVHDFKLFCRHFEAVVAWHAYEKSKEGHQRGAQD